MIRFDVDVLLYLFASLSMLAGLVPAWIMAFRESYWWLLAAVPASVSVGTLVVVGFLLVLTWMTQ